MHGSKNEVITIAIICWIFNSASRFLTKIIWENYYYFHFTNKKTESPDNLDSCLWFIQPGVSHDVLYTEIKSAGWQDTAVVLPSRFWTNVCFMSSCNCCFLTSTHVSQETDKVVWYSQLLKNFLQFAVIHTIKGFSIVNEAEIDVFLESPCFLYDPTDVGNLSLYPLPFPNPVCPSSSSRFTYSYSLAWRILSIILLACEWVW